ncbi:hypothetical protein IIC65_04770 [Candidatus Sumerlaeota bacterium]|nr:hypothetical protein [Candidatus Sumerlaeota bacterium]
MRFENTREAYAWLEGQIDYERKLDRVQYNERTFELPSFESLLDRLGNPHRGIASVHIAGTRGKGSSALMIEALLLGAARRVATFTSPHVREFRQRIRINGKPLSGPAFCRGLEEVAAAGRLRGGDGPSFKTVFEYLTALYFLAAREAKVDWMVVETGLGGRLDSTNVLDPGAVLLTRIGLEHTRLLGETIEEIASEKAAILKPGGWAVAGRQDAEGGAHGVFRRRERAVAGPDSEDPAMAALSSAEELCPLLEANYHPDGMDLRYRSGEEEITLRLPLFGPFQSENLQGALAMVAQLKSRGLVSYSSLAELARVLTGLTLPARMERIARSSDGGEGEGARRVAELYVDAGHCPTAASGIARAMGAHFGLSPAVAVIGMMADKDHGAFFQALARWPGWTRVLCYTPEMPRAEPAEDLARQARRFFSSVEVCGSLKMALESAHRDVEKENRIVAAGSIYGVASILDWSASHGEEAFAAQGAA